MFIQIYCIAITLVEREAYIMLNIHRRISFTAIFFVVFVVGGCATSTPYQKSGLRGGYTDFETQPSIYYVSFRGNAYTRKETVIRYWYQRAAEICGGTDRYEIVSQETSSNQYITGDVNNIDTAHKSRAEGYIKCKK